MQRLAPWLAIGYLRKGYIYDMRGLRHEAIRVYDQELNSIPRDNPSYQLVANGRSSSKEALHHRLDLLTRLPPDILSNIIPRFVGNKALSSDKEYPYLDVSTAWRHLIPSVASLHFIVDQPYTIDHGHNQLVSVSKHVKALTLQNCPKTINRLFQRAFFDTLTQLTIQANEDSFLLLLRALGQKLTHLTINKLVIEDASSIRLRWILLDCNCPNLKSLVIRNVYTEIDSLHYYPKLEQLWLKNTGQSYQWEMVRDLLLCFPSLKEIQVETLLDPCKLRFIQETCPSFYAEITEFLVKRCETLMACRLYLGQVGKSNQNSSIDLPSNIQFNQLSTLHIAYEGQEYCDTWLFKWIIQRSPNLRTLYAHGIPATHSEIIPWICKLTSLNCAIFDVSHDDQVEPILQFLQHHHSLGTQSNLHHVVLVFPEFTSHLWKLLSAIAELPQLHKLRIEMKDNDRGIEMLRFVNILALHYPHLECMDLICRQGIRDGVLGQFSHMKSLKTLRLFTTKLSMVDTRALSKCRGLQKLRVYGCTPSQDVVSYIKPLIPSFKFDPTPNIPMIL
ncbi:hypothetical protein K492DRAFT_200551 [Lichtheimia hyalospora FSU 10163]|nr:hypothetical protein K492DRAFT_200551 [Lichtheimia hyalospora FSU 10163]